MKSKYLNWHQKLDVDKRLEKEGFMNKLVYEVKQGCTLCGMCIYECPVSAITMTSKGARIDPKVCIGCGECAGNCASEAIVEK